MYFEVPYCIINLLRILFLRRDRLSLVQFSSRGGIPAATKSVSPFPSLAFSFYLEDSFFISATLSNVALDMKLNSSTSTTRMSGLGWSSSSRGIGFSTLTVLSNPYIQFLDVEPPLGELIIQSIRIVHGC